MRPLWRTEASHDLLHFVRKAGELLFAAVIAFLLFALIFITLTFGD